MPLTPGTKLGQYEVVESIGAGGMGEVYRARDLKLGRDVAVKVLPEEFARDKERLDRFEREARLLAQLNHANVATLHGLEEHDGQKFLVMELVEGETLAERIARGPLPLDEVIPLFIQIAEGLEAAHEKGIIHRDLKPANIKIGLDGKPKILDFGLAKAFGGTDETAPDSSQSPTLTKGTALGVILGTASYMSPEQARGKAVDKRTDVWAFGAVLYETLTAKKAFDGETVTDILASVVGKEPQLERVPAGARRLVGKCLVKDVNWRLQHIGDARLELRETDGAAEEPSLKRTSSVSIAAALVASLVTGVIVWSVMRSGSADRTVRRLSVRIPETDRFGTSLGVLGPPVAISPDGRDIVYWASRDGVRQLFHRPLERSEAAPMLGTTGAMQPFFSPDGEWVAFFDDTSIKRVSLHGGQVATITEADLRSPMGGTWGTDGSIVFTPSLNQGLFMVSSQGGEAVPITELGGKDVSHRWPTILRDREALLYEAWESTGTGRILVQELGDDENRVLLEEAQSPFYVPTGHLVFHRSGAMWAVRFDIDTLEIEGDAVPVLEDVYTPFNWSAALTFANDGTIAYVSRRSVEQATRTTPVWVRRDGSNELVAELYDRTYQDPRLSRDGRALLLGSFKADEPSSIWILDLQRETLSRLTSGMRPIWTPSGDAIVFASVRAGQADIYKMPLSGDGELEQLSSGEYRVPISISPDGTTILFRRWSSRGDRDVGVLRLDRDDEPALLLHTEFNEHTAMFSRDGRWIAYVTDESGREEVYVRTFPELENQKQVSTEGGSEPLWSPDGSELFYRSPQTMMAVSITNHPSLSLGRPEPLFDDPYRRSDLPATSYDVSADGQRFLMLQTRGNLGPQEIVVVLNWFEELNRLVPTN